MTLVWCAQHSPCERQDQQRHRHTENSEGATNNSDHQMSYKGVGFEPLPGSGDQGQGNQGQTQAIAAVLGIEIAGATAMVAD